MRRYLIGALWGVAFYVIGYFLTLAIAGREAAESFRGVISIVAATLAAAGSWRGFLPGTRTGKDRDR